MRLRGDTKRANGRGPHRWCLRHHVSDAYSTLVRWKSARLATGRHKPRGGTGEATKLVARKKRRARSNRCFRANRL
jgi:hypothetical protein